MNNVNTNKRSTGFQRMRSLGWSLALITAATFLVTPGVHGETMAHQYQNDPQEIPCLEEEDPLVVQEMANLLSAGRSPDEALAIQNAVFANQLEVVLEYGVTLAELQAALVSAREIVALNSVPVVETPVVEVPVVETPVAETPVIVVPVVETPVVETPVVEHDGDEDVPVAATPTNVNRGAPANGAPARAAAEHVLDHDPADCPDPEVHYRAQAMAQTARNQAIGAIAPSHGRTYVPPGMFTTREQESYAQRSLIEALAPLANANAGAAMAPIQNEPCAVDEADAATEAFNELSPEEQKELQNLLLQQMESELTGNLCSQYRAPSFWELVEIAKKNVRNRRGSADGGDTGTSGDPAVDTTTEGEDGGYLGSDDETDEEDDDFGLTDDFMDSLDDYDAEMDAEEGTGEDSTPDATDDGGSEVSGTENPDDGSGVTDGGSVATDDGPVVTDDELRGYFEDKAQGHRDRATEYRDEAAGYRDRAAAARARADAARDRANSAETEENRASWEEQAESWDDAADIYDSTADLFEDSAASEDGFADEFQNDANQVGSVDTPAGSDASGGQDPSAGVDDNGLSDDGSGSAPPAVADAVRGVRAPANWKAFPGSHIGSYEVDALYDWWTNWSRFDTAVMSVYYYLPDELSDAELSAIVKKCKDLPTDKEKILCVGAELHRVWRNDNDRVCRHFTWATAEVLETMGFHVDLWGGRTSEDGGHAWAETTADGQTVLVDVFSGHYVVIE